MPRGVVANPTLVAVFHEGGNFRAGGSASGAIGSFNFTGFVECALMHAKS